LAACGNFTSTLVVSPPYGGLFKDLEIQTRLPYERRGEGAGEEDCSSISKRKECSSNGDET